MGKAVNIIYTFVEKNIDFANLSGGLVNRYVKIYFINTSSWRERPNTILVADV